MYTSLAVLSASAAFAVAQSNYPPPPVLLTSTKSGVLPVLPTPFTGVLTNEGAIIAKAPINSSYTPVGGPAATQTGLPAATYVATIQQPNFLVENGTTITGSVTASSKAGDSGVTVTVNLSGFPDLAAFGPFVYHIHDQPVPAGGNCTATMGHFDVTNAGEYYTCNPATPQLCQTGDLAGKHGKINGTSFSTSYNEPFISTSSSSAYFIGAKSITIHTSNTTRLACGNFALVAANSTTTASNGTVVSGSPSSTSSKPATFTGAASKTAVGGAALGVAALFGLLL